MRPEYEQLARDFDWHAAAVGWLPGPAVRQDMGVFLIAMERIDQHLDALTVPLARRRFSDAVLERIGGEPSPLPATVEASVDRLRDVLERRGRAQAFVALAQEGLGVTEELRGVHRVAPYLRLVRREGRITTDLALMTVHPVPERLRRVFDRLGDIGNHVDELLDLRADHRGGVRVIGCNLKVRAALLWELLRGVPPLLAAHPRPVGMLLRGSSYLLQRFPSTAATPAGSR